MRASRLNLKDPPSESFHIHSVNRAEREQLETANQKISRLESEKSMLLQAKTDSMVKAAKAEGIAEQLELNMKKSEGQLNSWVSMRFRLASYEADMSLSDCSGSVIP